MEESVTYFQLYKLSPSATLEVAILSMSCHVVVNTASLEGGGTLIINCYNTPICSKHTLLRTHVAPATAVASPDIGYSISGNTAKREMFF